MTTELGKPTGQSFPLFSIGGYHKSSYQVS